MKNSLLIIAFLISGFSVLAQDMEYTRKIINEICSAKYYGRGYVNKGDSIAASFLGKEFSAIGLEMYGNTYFQPYTTDINRFAETPVFSFGGTDLVAAKDFIVIPSSPEADGKSYNFV